MKKISKEFQTVKRIADEETMQLLAEIWSNNKFRDYMMNRRNMEISAIRKIKTGSIEGDALALQRGNGKVEAIEDFMTTCQRCYKQYAKLIVKRDTRNSILEVSDDDRPYAA